MKRLFIALALLFVASMAQAQDTLTPNTPVTGTISEEALTVKYTFDGVKGTPLVFEMVSPNPLEGLSEPALILTAPDESIVADATSWFQTLGGYGESYIAVVLPSDGTYTLTATRTEMGSTVGEYTLTMIEPTVLEPGTVFSGEVSSEGGFDFYVYNPKDAFSVTYTRTDGDYTPELAVNVLDDEEGSLEGLGYAFGTGTDVYTLGYYEPGETYFISVGSAEAVLSAQFYFDVETAAYTLEIGFAE